MLILKSGVTLIIYDSLKNYILPRRTDTASSCKFNRDLSVNVQSKSIILHSPPMLDESVYACLIFDNTDTLVSFTTHTIFTSKSTYESYCNLNGYSNGEVQSVELSFIPES